MLAAALVVGGCAPSEEDPGDGAPAAGETTTTEGSSFVDGRFTSTEGGFSLVLPAEPEAIRRQEKAGDVTLDVVIYDVAVSDTEAYQVSFVDYPESIGGLDPPKVLDGAIVGAVQRVNGALESRSDATLDGLPAMDGEITAALPIFVRVALSGRRLFTLQQVGPAERTPAYDRLLETFRLED